MFLIVAKQIKHMQYMDEFGSGVSLVPIKEIHSKRLDTNFHRQETISQLVAVSVLQ